MRLGIDFGTTRIVVAAVDRGNYPLVSFEGPGGTWYDWFPPLVAIRGPVRVYGWAAWQAQEERGWTVVRSIKRYLEQAGPYTRVQLGDQQVSMVQLLQELLSELRRALIEDSSLNLEPDERLQAVVGVPANANSNQRFLTVEGFRLAGFDVLGLVNEPSAASIEFVHAQQGKLPARGSGCLLVYDLGGGTFDVSLVNTAEQAHAVVASDGIPTLGGDDFDSVLAELALEAAGIDDVERDTLTQAEWFRLHEECRRLKESLNPNTRRITVDLAVVREDWPVVTIPVSDFYQLCRPMIEETIAVTQQLLASQGVVPDVVYVTGGGAELPLVPRMLREVFGRRVRRSSYTHSATAVGLAIQADEQARYLLRDCFTRNFGVWREAEGGQRILFDPLFVKGTPLPAPDEPPLRVSRHYRPVHNIGHFRYLECARHTGDGQPTGDIVLWDDILFPFDPALRNVTELERIPVTHSEVAPQQEILETYSCDAAGRLTVTIANLSAGYERSYKLARWAPSQREIVPGKPLRRGELARR